MSNAPRILTLLRETSRALESGDLRAAAEAMDALAPLLVGAVTASEHDEIAALLGPCVQLAERSRAGLSAEFERFASAQRARGRYER